MKASNISQLCRVCLRTDKNLRAINPNLAKFHYELCLIYTSEFFKSQFCAECDHMLKKMYNFKEKCKKAARLYHDFIHNLLPGEKSLINITELHKCMPESPLGHWMPANNKMFSYQEGVDTELDELDNIEISGEIKQTSLKTYCKPKQVTEMISRKEETNLNVVQRTHVANNLSKQQRWGDEKVIPAETPFKVHETNTVSNVSLLAKTSKVYVANTETNKKVILLSKTLDPISVVSNQSETFNTSNMDDDNDHDYEDSNIIEEDPLRLPFKDEISNTPKPQPIVIKECSVVLTPIKVFQKVTTRSNILIKHSDDTLVKPVQENDLPNTSIKDFQNVTATPNILIKLTDSTPVKPVQENALPDTSIKYFQKVTATPNILIKLSDNTSVKPVQQNDLPDTPIKDFKKVTATPNILRKLSDNTPVKPVQENDLPDTPMKDFKKVTTIPNILKKRSDNTPVKPTQENAPPNKLTEILRKYNIKNVDLSNLKEAIPLRKAGTVNRVPEKAAGNINVVRNEDILQEIPKSNTATMQEKNISEDNVTTTHLLYAGLQKVNTLSTNMPVKMLTEKNTTLNATAVQKVNTASKHTPLKTISKDTVTKLNADTFKHTIGYPKINLQDLLSSKANSEVIIEDLLTDWDNVVEIESEELTQPVEVESEEKSQVIESNVEIVYDSKSGVIYRKMLGEKSAVRVKMDQPISRKRSPTSNVSLSSNGDVMYKERTENSDVNESKQSTIDNVKRVKMKQQDSTQTSNVKNTGSNDPNTKANVTTIKKSKVKTKIIKKRKDHEVPVICKKIKGLQLSESDIELLKYSKERLKAALLIKFASCGELKVKDSVIDQQFVMECLDQRVPENVLRRLWRYVLYDVKDRRYSKTFFSPDTLRIFRSIQKRYTSEKMYQDVFDIQYMTTEMEMREEFQMRKHYPCYIKNSNRCHICYRVFKFAMLREIHMNSHIENPGDIACEICHMRFTNIKIAEKHKDSHKAVYKCKRCPLVTYRWNVMVNHYNQHIGKEFKCIPCGKSYKNLSTYKSHMATRLHGRFVCTTCGRNFGSESGLKQHRTYRHKNAVLPEDGASVQCDECPLAFPSQEVLLTHKKYSHESMLPKFSNLHKNSRECRLCGAKGNNNMWLRHHFRKEHPAEILDLVYADVKSHLCHYCGHGCTTIKSLTEHIKKHTEKARDRPKENKEESCNICGKTFSHKGLLLHIKTHTFKHQYKCALCRRTYLRLKAIVKHLRHFHKLTGSEVETHAAIIKKERILKNIPWGTDGKGVEEKTERGIDGIGVETKTEWGNDGEGNTERGNDGEDAEENTAWGNDGKEAEEKTAWANNGEETEDKIEWVNDGEEENTEWGNDGDASATEEVAEETETWGTEEEIVEEDTVWGTVIQSEDVPVWITEVQNEEEVPAWGEEMEVE